MVAVVLIKVGVKIQLASNGLTKIVAFSPFFVLMNKAQVLYLFYKLTTILITC